VTKPIAQHVLINFQHDERGTAIDICAYTEEPRLKIGLVKKFNNDQLEHILYGLIRYSVDRIMKEFMESVTLTGAQERFLWGSILCALEAHIDCESNNSG
jgi:hypothetical protein